MCRLKSRLRNLLRASKHAPRLEDADHRSSDVAPSGKLRQCVVSVVDVDSSINSSAVINEKTERVPARDFRADPAEERRLGKAANDAGNEDVRARRRRAPSDWPSPLVCTARRHLRSALTKRGCLSRSTRDLSSLRKVLLALSRHFYSIQMNAAFERVLLLLRARCGSTMCSREKDFA